MSYKVKNISPNYVQIERDKGETVVKVNVKKQAIPELIGDLICYTKETCCVCQKKIDPDEGAVIMRSVIMASPDAPKIAPPYFHETCYRDYFNITQEPTPESQGDQGKEDLEPSVPVPAFVVDRVNNLFDIVESCTVFDDTGRAAIDDMKYLLGTILIVEPDDTMTSEIAEDMNKRIDAVEKAFTSIKPSYNQRRIVEAWPELKRFLGETCTRAAKIIARYEDPTAPDQSKKSVVQVKEIADLVNNILDVELSAELKVDMLKRLFSDYK